MTILLKFAVFLPLLVLFCECMDNETPGRKRKAAASIVINEPSEGGDKVKAQATGKGKEKIGHEASVEDASKYIAKMTIDKKQEENEAMDDDYYAFEKALKKDDFTSDDPAEKYTFTFICNDTADMKNGLKLDVSIEAMELSGIFKNIINDERAKENPNEQIFLEKIPVPTMDETMLRLIIKWCEWQIYGPKKAKAEEEEKKRKLDELAAADEKTPLIANAQIVEPLEATASNAETKPSENKDNQNTPKNKDTREIATRPRGVVSEWSEKFLTRFGLMQLCKIIQAANYLEIEILVTDGCVVLDNKYLRGKTPAQIRKAFNIDLTKSHNYEQDLTVAQRENAWFTGLFPDEASSSSVPVY